MAGETGQAAWYNQYSGAVDNAQGSSGSSGWGNYAAIGQAAGDLSTSIYALMQGLRESPQSQAARHVWGANKGAAERLLPQLFYNPVAEGYQYPYSNPEDPNSYYKWAPSNAMQSLYSSYLGRQYGLPESVGRSMAAQAMAPIRLQDLGKARTSGQLRQATQVSPMDFASAAMGAQTPEALRRLDIMKGAAKTSAFNLWRAQKLREIVG